MNWGNELFLVWGWSLYVDEHFSYLEEEVDEDDEWSESLDVFLIF